MKTHKILKTAAICALTTLFTLACIACDDGSTSATVTDPAILDFYGTYTRTQGGYQPYTVTITADSFNFIDKDEDWINHANITWTAATNTATDASNITSTGDYLTYGGVLTNPSEAYPTGYTITGSKTVEGWTREDAIPSGFFIALSADKNTLYVASSASNYNRAGFNNLNMADSIFTRVAE